MSEQVHYEDVDTGDAVPVLTVTVDETQMFFFSAATYNGHRIHYDKEYTLTEGYHDVIVHGPLRGAFLSQLLTRWIGEEGTLKKLLYTNRDIAYVNELLTCKGTVTRRWIDDGQGYVECEVWVENEQGNRVTPGKATVILPRKESRV